jgi:hypothetical protein
MATQTKPPPREKGGGGDIVGSTYGDEKSSGPDDANCNMSLQGRYCQPVALCLLTDALLDKIEWAMICREALHVDGFDLLLLSEDYLPLWLGDAPKIVASDILVGKTIRAAFLAEGITCPPLYVEGVHV